MKFIIVKGDTQSGQKATIKEICRRTKPEKIERVTVREGKRLMLYNVYSVENMQDKTYILHTKGKKILVVASPPAQQQISISRLVSILAGTDIFIDLAIIALNTCEKLSSLATGTMTEDRRTAIKKPEFTPPYGYFTSEGWRKHIAYLESITSHYLQ